MRGGHVPLLKDAAGAADCVDQRLTERIRLALHRARAPVSAEALLLQVGGMIQTQGTPAQERMTTAIHRRRRCGMLPTI